METQNKVDAIFEKFAAAITRHNEAIAYWATGSPLPFEAGDFMLMNVAPDGRGYYGFKHYNTRNYVLVNASNGRIVIPKTGGPFSRGEF